ncbi:MAG TPA: RNA polymerase sigma factor [Candidatus Acidoferrales bacterium]|nr:RNA polymerase sigma factor [Candidatus Acidoferrales bacterium]
MSENVATLNSETMPRETFAALLAPYLHSIRRLVQTRMRGSDQADDVVQQTLLRAYLRRDQLRAPSKFRNWLWSIAINEIRMLQRAARPCVSIDESPAFELTDRAPTPVALCEQSERVRHLQAGMARLNRRDRTAIRLVDLNELTVAEAARTLDISQAAFKSTHFRARKRLGHALRKIA